MSLQKETCQERRSAFTLVELLIVIGIIVVLIAIIMPATQMVRQTQRESHCAHNLTQIGKAYQRVMEASDGQLGAAIRADEKSANSTAWVGLLQTYLGNDPAIFHCVEHDDASAALSYGINNRAELLVAGDKIVALDYTKPVANYVGPAAPEGVDWRDLYDDWPSLNAPRHRGRMNIVYRDGRVDSSGPNEINPTNCFYYEKFWKPARATGLNRQCLNQLDQVVTGSIVPPTVTPPPPAPTGTGTPTGGGSGGAGQQQDPFDKKVNEGLIWLVRHQMGNGGWTGKHSMGGNPPCGARCDFEADGTRPAFATGVALLVFLGAGNSSGEGDFKEVVAKGVSFLVGQVGANGDVGGNNYERAFAVMALVEALRAGAANQEFGGVDPTVLRATVERAVARVAACEYVEGGFRYGCGQAPDTSVTAAMTQSIKSAEVAKLNVPGLDGILSRLHDWLDKGQQNVINDPGDGSWSPRFADLGTRYSYTTTGGSQRMWAAGGYMRVYMNPELKYHPAMISLCKTIRDIGPQQDRYFDFYAHHFMRMMGEGGPGECSAYWGTWRSAMDQLMTSTRETDGHERGSWDDPGNQFPWASQLGRHGVTCFSLLNLKDYYSNITLTDG